MSIGKGEMIKGWTFERLIGQGAFAKVYLLRQEQEGQGGNTVTCKVACKVAESEAERTILERETEIMKTLEHPLFAKYVDFVRDGQRAMLLMEYVEGEGLGEVLERGALPQEQAVRIATELADGLRYLHELPHPMLYRDLKPDNIRIQPDGRARLLDLGCVCRVEEAGKSWAGSRGYAAPEQMLEGMGAIEQVARHRETPVAGQISEGRIMPGFYSDVYALGRLLHYMLTGQNPCQPPYRKHPIRIYNSALSPLLEQLVEQCTAEEAVRRLPDMRGVQRRLGPFLEQGKSVSLKLYELLALLRWRLSGRKWEGDFLYEKTVCKRPEKSGCSFS